ncbi:hypothetical protein F471_03751 [Pseudomonas sp. URMO17WK12:I1]|uniref:hypothetical protein n=1 Tax=unclassified Pseudomonas TaxID=196821 RepID=UPI0004BB0428|nr:MULTISPECIES: hypothetical protein [unclassified Pseudomonas]PZW65273.1 hypothetical protein F471_03751 [Pseudomonas sp. URMO17WK12:I1]
MSHKYFKDADGVPYAFEADGSQDAFIPPGLVAMTDAEVAAHLAPPDLSPVRIAEIDAELIALDLASVRPLRSVLAAAEPAPEDVAKLAELDAQAAALREERALLLPPPPLLEPVQSPEPEAGQPQ